jgi:hypothetical protein
MCFERRAQHIISHSLLRLSATLEAEVTIFSHCCHVRGYDCCVAGETIFKWHHTHMVKMRFETKGGRVYLSLS